jgi:hypothetical protein
MRKINILLYIDSSRSVKSLHHVRTTHTNTMGKLETAIFQSSAIMPFISRYVLEPLSANFMDD